MASAVNTDGLKILFGVVYACCSRVYMSAHMCRVQRTTSAVDHFFFYLTVFLSHSFEFNFIIFCDTALTGLTK